MILLADREDSDQTANTQADLGRRCLHMSRDTVFYMAHFIFQRN